jgi:hypothetical protein
VIPRGRHLRHPAGFLVYCLELQDRAARRRFNETAQWYDHCIEPDLRVGKYLVDKLV